MELFVKICLKIKKKIFLKACLNYLLKKDVAYHFPRRTIRYENPLLSGKVNRQHIQEIVSVPDNIYSLLSQTMQRRELLMHRTPFIFT